MADRPFSAGIRAPIASTSYWPSTPNSRGLGRSRGGPDAPRIEEASWGTRRFWDVDAPATPDRVLHNVLWAWINAITAPCSHPWLIDYVILGQWTCHHIQRPGARAECPRS